MGDVPITHGPDSASALPWERSTGPSADTGICLSGGGMRSASFSLGVLQVLQERQGLLFGPASATHLAAVSGGSYIASAYVANGVHLSRDDPRGSIADPPFTPGSPEERHLLTHGRYLITPWWMRLPALLANLLTGPVLWLVLIVWAGFMIADLAGAIEYVGRGMGVGSWRPEMPLWVLLVGCFTVLALLGRTATARSAGPKLGWWVLSVAGAILFFPPAIEALHAIPALQSMAGWWVVFAVGAGAVACTAAAGLVLGPRRAPDSGILVPEVLEAYSVRALLVAILLCAATLQAPLVDRVFEDRATTADHVWFWAVIVAPPLLVWALRPLSLHQFYRERIASAFGVLRNPDGTVSAPTAVPLSALGGGAGPDRPVPRLLICATANLRHRDALGNRRGYASFVFSHDACGIPDSEMRFSTRQLELAQSDGYLTRRPEPMVTLPTSVAATGAAITPSMGRHTRAGFRLAISLLNVRLGRTLPNAGDPTQRAQVEALTAPARLKAKVGIARGYDDLLAELLGSSGPNMYVSDGGHDDNLGLLTLLRARCATVWCVDATPDPQGLARELERITTRAVEELQIHIELDTSVFAATTRGVLGATHASGTIHYGGGATGELHVIKLGLHAKTPDALREYATEDRGFPHHSTLRQLYGERRIRAYRDLGRDIAARCLDDVSDRRAKGAATGT